MLVTILVNPHRLLSLFGCSVDLLTVELILRWKSHHGVVKISRDRSPVPQRLFCPLYPLVERLVHPKSSLNPLKNECRNFPSALFSRYSISASSSGSTQMPRCAMRFVYG